MASGKDRQGSPRKSLFPAVFSRLAVLAPLLVAVVIGSCAGALLDSDVVAGVAAVVVLALFAWWWH